MASACKIFTFYHDCMYKAIYATSRIIQLEKCFSNMRARNIIEKMSDRITREFPTQYFFSTYTLTENKMKKKQEKKEGIKMKIKKTAAIRSIMRISCCIIAVIQSRRKKRYFSKRYRFVSFPQI